MDSHKRLMQHFTGRKLTWLLISLAVGLLLMCLLSGKSRRDIESLAVSSDEQYVAFFETGEGYKLRCYRVDGSQSFEYAIPSELSAGGFCVVWFESDTVCALFYRTNKVAHFSPDGTLLNIYESNWEEYPSAFPGFDKKGTQYIYEGNHIDIIYNKRNIFAYWLFGAERQLAVDSNNGEKTILLSWSAT